MSRPKVLVLYATRHGQARKIADRMAAVFESKGANAEVINAAGLEPWFDLGNYAAAVLVASVHIGKHEPEMVAFARKHKKELSTMPAAFVSVSLAEATIEGRDRPPEARAQAQQTLRAALDLFVAKTGWQPRIVRPFAGALLYREYNFLIRFIMRSIARRTGADLDTSRNYEYTDWAAVDRFAGEFVVDQIGAAGGAAAASG